MTRKVWRPALFLVVLATGALAQGSLQQGGDSGVTQPQEEGGSTRTGPESKRSGTERAEGRPTQWPERLKNIPLGPGALDVTLSIRFRYEFLDNYDTKRYDSGRDEELGLSRVRLNLDYHVGDDFRAFLQVQDSHFDLSHFGVGDFAPTCPYQNHADIKQGYVQWTHLGGTPLGFKVGRQTLAYGDKRVFCPGDWGNVGRYTWDAAKLIWDCECLTLDVFFARRVQWEARHFDNEHFGFRVLGAYAQIKRLPFKLEPFWVYRYDEKGTARSELGRIGDERRASIGFHVDGVVGERTDYGGTFAYQVGDFAGDELDACGCNARIGYTFDLPWQPRLGVEFSYASGDSDPGDGRHQTLDGIFGAVAPYYGLMNLCCWKNLEDYQVSLGAKPCKALVLTLDYHLFRLAQAEDAWYYGTNSAQRRDPTGNSGRTLGQEIDLVAKWKVTPNLTVMGGYGHFFPGEFINATGPGDDADWVFAQFEFSM